MNAPLVAAVLLGMSLASCATKPAEKRNVTVAVVAHPDDEAAMAQLLVKYGKTNKVYVIILTDGRYGVKPGFPTGDALVKLRQAESECACAALGIEPPIFLGFTDGFDTTDQTKDGIRAYFERSTQLKRVLAEKIEELNPDAIVTDIASRKQNANCRRRVLREERNHRQAVGG